MRVPDKIVRDVYNELPQDHLAYDAHFECRHECVGKEIPWRGRENEAFDQEWHSESDGHNWSFSSFAYAFISFDLQLLDVIEQQDTTHDEEHFRDRLARARALLYECEQAARQNNNERILDCIDKARRFFDLWENAVDYRNTN